jgi:predicted membrane protein
METNSCSSSGFAKSKGILFGLLLVIAGLLFLSFNFGWIDAALRPVIFSWPMIFVVIGIVSFSKNNYLVSLFWLILGFFFLLPRIGVAFPGFIQGIDDSFARTYWPLLLILLGVAFILRVVLGQRGHAKGHHRPSSTEAVEGRINRSVVFGGSESIFLEPVFNGGDISVIFGGVVLDLRKTKLPEGDTYINIEAIFGGVELYVPDDWIVESKLQTVMGGFQDKRHISDADKSRKLILKGDLIFGGCEII